MTLIEAIKTGKRIRRAGTGWLEQGEIPLWIKLVDFNFIVADDWEVEPAAPKYTLAECLLILSAPKHEFGYHTITDELRLSILHHLKSIKDSTLSSSKDTEAPKSTSVGVEKY